MVSWWIVAGLMILAVIAFVYAAFAAGQRFGAMVQNDMNVLRGEQGENPGRVTTTADLNQLPECVQRWLIYARVVGKEIPRLAVIKHSGAMRTGQGKGWMPFQAEYLYSLEKPAFIWHVDVQAAPLIHLVGRDMLYRGKGHMLIKLLALFAVADEKGPEIDQGSLLRYLGEMVWFPFGAFQEYITWEAISADSARVTLREAGMSVSGIMTFNEIGQPIQFSAMRYRSENGRYTLNNWVINLHEYQCFDGVNIPSQVEVIWEMSDGPFEWFTARIQDLWYE